MAPKMRRPPILLEKYKDIHAYAEEHPPAASGMWVSSTGLGDESIWSSCRSWSRSWDLVGRASASCQFSANVSLRVKYLPHLELGKEKFTHLYGLHGTLLEDLLDGLVLVIRAELGRQGALGSRVICALGALPVCGGKDSSVSHRQKKSCTADEETHLCVTKILKEETKWASGMLESVSHFL